MHKWTTKSRRKELYTWYCVCVVKPSDKTHDTKDNVTTKTQSTFHTAHMNIDTWSECARSSLVCFVSQVLVVMIAHHIVAQVSLVRVISWSSHDECISSILSLPFPSTSSSSHSSSISCTSSCTSSTTLRAVVTLRTSLERRWTLLTNPTSSQVMSPRTTTSWRVLSSPSQSPWPTHSSSSNGSSRMLITMTPRSRRCFITHTEYMSITPSEKTCLSVSRRRPCPSERRDPLESEQGDLLDLTSSDWVFPYQGGCSQVLISSKGCDSSICDWRNKFSIPPRTWCIQGTIQARVSFQIDGFLTGPSLQGDSQPMNQGPQLVLQMVAQNVFRMESSHQLIHLECSSRGIPFRRICPPIFIQTWLQQYSRGAFLYSAHFSFNIPICFRSVWCRSAMIPGEIFTGFPEFQGFVCLNDLWLPIGPQKTFASFFVFLAKFWFCTDMPGSSECPSLAPRLHIGACFEIRNCHWEFGDLL